MEMAPFQPCKGVSFGWREVYDFLAWEEGK